MSIPLINGRAYSYAEIVVTILGAPLSGITEVNYTEEQEKTNNFGTGDRPVSRGRGAIDANGSIGISMNDVEALRDVAPDGSLLKLPAFDIVVTYGNSQKVVTHICKNCEFLSDGVEMSTGDTDVNRSFDLVISDVKYR